MNLRRWWKSRCVETDPLAQPAEVLRDRVGLPRHRSRRPRRRRRTGRRSGRRPAELGSIASSTVDLRAQDRQRQRRRAQACGPDGSSSGSPASGWPGEIDDRRRHSSAGRAPRSTSRSAPQRAQLGPPQPGRRGDEDRAGHTPGAARLLGRVDQRPHLVRCRHDGRGVRDRRRLGPLRRVRVPPAPSARLREHRREAGVDLVDAARPTGPRCWWAP